MLNHLLRSVVVAALLSPVVLLTAPTHAGTGSLLMPSESTAHQPNPCHHDAQPLGHGPSSGDNADDCTTGQELEDQA